MHFCALAKRHVPGSLEQVLISSVETSPRMTRSARAVILISCFLIPADALAATATTYYVDYAGGSDSNNGTAKTTPWQHLPGMPGCQAQCSSASPGPGDQFILKGGVTWPNSSLGWEWTWNGSAGNPLYIGVDQTWFAGSAWTRPIFNGGGQPIPTWNDGNHTPRVNEFFGLSANYVVVDNIEWTGFFEDNTNTYCQDDYICLHYSSNNLELKNNYFHGWTHAPYNGSTSNDGGQCISGDTSWPSGNSNSSVHDNVFDGWDTTGDSMAALHGGPEVIYNNYVNNTSNGFVGEYTLAHDNVVLNINASYNPTMHENGLEINFSGTSYFYNNIFAHVKQGLTVWLAPELGYTHYFYNNLIYDIPITNISDLAAALVKPTGSDVLYNNTIECGPDGTPAYICVANIAASVTAVTLENNHWITNLTSPNNGVWTSNGPHPTESKDVPMTYLAACTQGGYCPTETYPFSPTSGTGATVGQGANLTSLCPSLPGLCNDTTLGVSYNATDHTVSYPSRTPNPRPASGAWDVGAYEYNSGNQPPQPPTGLTALVH
jgi:hypothetical protein